jgi:hypothetical protein
LAPIFVPCHFSIENLIAPGKSAPVNPIELFRTAPLSYFLGRSLVEQFGLKEIKAFPGLAQQVISLDPSWLTY